MDLRTYLREKKNKALSKYIHLQNKVVSKFHLPKRAEEEKEANCFIDEIEVKLEEGTNGAVTKAAQPRSATKKNEVHKNSLEHIGAKNQLPKGYRVVTIIVREGKIIEKVYLTPQEERVSFKGKNL